LRKLQHRIFVIDLLGALDIRTDERETAPHRFEDCSLRQPLASPWCWDDRCRWTFSFPAAKESSTRVIAARAQ
jgi:hypothetical protein